MPTIKKSSDELRKKYAAAKYMLDLRPRYFELFEFRHGLADGKTHSLRECGEHFGISPERARQMEARVIDALQDFDTSPHSQVTSVGT